MMAKKKTYLCIFTLFSVLLPGGAAAEDITVNRLCTAIHNKAPYTVFGTVGTDYYTNPDGIRARHRSNFRLETDETIEFCTQGPFFEGRRVELVLRSLVPLFSCKTRVDAGPVIIRGQRKPDGSTETWADCY